MKNLALKALGALAILSVLFVAALGPSASVRVASADRGHDDSTQTTTSGSSSSNESYTHVVVKIRAGSSIDTLVKKITTWKCSSNQRFQVVVEKQFPGTDIYLIRVLSCDAKQLANRLNNGQVIWAEPGIFTPSSESSRFRQVASEQFRQAAYEQFRQASYEQFRQAAYEQFRQAAYEQFRQAAFDQFRQAAFDQFRQAAFEQFAQAAYDQFRQAAYDRFSQAAFDQFTQSAYDQFSQAAFDQFRQAAYDAFTQAAYDRFSQAVYDQFRQAAFEQFSATVFDRFSQAVYDQFRQAAYDAFTQAAYEQFRQAAYDQFRQAVYDQFSQATYEQFAKEVLERFSQAIYDEFARALFEQFTQAVFDQFRQAVYETFDPATLDAFIQATYEQFRQAVYEQFRQAIYEQFHKAVYDSLTLVVASLAEDPDFQLVMQQLIVGFITAVREDQLARATSQTALGQIHVTEAQARATGQGVTVAVIDTGVYATHWFLDGAILPGIDLVDGDSNPTEIGNGIDDNRNGAIDEGLGHGTFIAGLIHLVAPDAKILPIRVQDDEGDGWSFLVAEGIYRAVDAGANVINLSLSVPETSHVLREATDYATRRGVVIVAAAGNDSQKIALYPAAYDHVIGVGAVDSNNQKASFSNYGNKSVEVVAPGVDLYGPYPVPGTMGMAHWSGTSFSTALVSGEAALVFQLQAGVRRAADRVTDSILGTATDLDAIDLTYGDQLGRGLINLYAAVVR